MWCGCVGVSVCTHACMYVLQCNYLRECSMCSVCVNCIPPSNQPHFQMNVCKGSNNSSNSSQPHIYTPEDITGVKCCCNSTNHVVSKCRI